MKRHFAFITLMLAMAALIIGTVGCKKDDEENATFTLSTLKSGDIDMNGATSPSNIPPEPTITATFSVAVNASSANSNTITLDRDYDGTSIDLDITVSGSTVTIVPATSLGNGALYKLSFKAGISSTDGQALTPLDRTFTTEGSFLPAGQIAHWGFEDNANDDVGSWNPGASGVIDITYSESRNATAGKAAYFNGTTSIIEIPNGDQLMETQDFTLAFWAKAEEAGHGHFIIGLAAFYGFQFELFGGFDGFKMPVQFDLGTGASATGGDLAYNGDGLTLENGGWRGTVVNKEDGNLPDQLKEKWFHIVYVYDSESKERSMYLNGVQVIMQDHDLWYDDEGNPYPETGIVGLKYAGAEPETFPELAFGFVHSRAGSLWDNEPWGGYDFPDANHFMGWLDDVRIFHKPLSPQEIDLMYNSENQ